MHSYHSPPRRHSYTHKTRLQAQSALYQAQPPSGSPKFPFKGPPICRNSHRFSAFWESWHISAVPGVARAPPWDSPCPKPGLGLRAPGSVKTCLYVLCRISVGSYHVPFAVSLMLGVRSCNQKVRHPQQRGMA